MQSWVIAGKDVPPQPQFQHLEEVRTFLRTSGVTIHDDKDWAVIETIQGAHDQLSIKAAFLVSDQGSRWMSIAVAYIERARRS